MKKMKNKFLILFLLKFVLLMSQNGKDSFFPPAPEANSLIKYVDVPVNYSTGVTNYSIPIHTIKLKNLTIPITLTYQSSGLKPSEVAGNTGFGWELNAGGKITQNVVQKNDLDTHSPANPVWNLPNNRDFKLPFPVSDISWTVSTYSQTQLDSIHGAGTDYTTFTNIVDNNIDSQPDIFYYSTPNKSGKFFFGNNFETKQIPFGKEKIIYNSSNYTFEITDTDGVRYIYTIVTENLNSTESICLKFPKLNGMSNSNSYTFYLAQIITPNNETVDFVYDTVKYNLINDKDYTRYYHWFYEGGEKITSYSSEITTKVLTKIKVNQDYEIEFLYNKFRKDIKGKVQATAPKTLDNIKIKYKNEIETYQFNYGYFGLSDSQYNPDSFEGKELNEDTEYRLKLKSFQKTGENPYVFSYYNEEAVVRYNTCLDHWGYYSNSCQRYTMNTLFSDLGGTKQPNLEKTKTNVLKNISLPTKGEVEFNYELNNCSDCNLSYTSYNWEPFSAFANSNGTLTGEWVSEEREFTVPEKSIGVPFVNFNLISPGAATTSNYAIAELYDDQGHQMVFQLIGTTGNNFKPYVGDPLIAGKTYKLVLKCYDTMENEGKFVAINFLMASTVQEPIASVGGLRIKNIQTKEADDVITSRSFDYDLNGQSSGALYEKPFYYDEYSYFSEIADPNANTMANGLISYAVQYSRIPSDLFGFNGYHIFYKKVTEKNIDTKNISNIIKVEKYFTFYDDLRYGEQSYFSKISYNWKRGLPSQVNEFNKNDIVKKTTFSYRFLDTPAGDKYSSHDSGFPLMNATFPNEFHKRIVDVSIYRRNLSFYNLYNYTSSKLISAWYYMDKKITEEHLDGKILKTEEEYKYENATHAQLTSQTTINSKGEVLETKYAYPDDLSGELFMADLSAANRISTPIITEQYKDGALLSKNKTIFKKDASTSNLLVPKEMYSAKFPNDFPNISNVGKLEKKITYDQYDDKGNVLQYTTQSGTPVAIIWGYNKTLPIAKIEKLTYGQIAPYTANLQTLSNADDDNCMSSGCNEQILRNQLDGLRTVFPQSMITTYTYNPLVGVTSITDTKGIVSYYEYDSFGRLKFVKDQELNVLQKYCYNYKGQQVDCSDNSSTSVFIYKSAARSGSFTKNNCTSGGVPSSVSFSLAAGSVTSTISQQDADAKATAKFNTEGQVYANTNGSCTFYSKTLSGSFNKSNCPAGGFGASVPFSQIAGVSTSNTSQAEADALAMAIFNTNGKANANANGNCTFYNVAMNATFTKNNCDAGGFGSNVRFGLIAGITSSNISQADADAQALAILNANGQVNANTNGNCTFYSAARSGYFTKNNCTAGGSGSAVLYNQGAGVVSSNSSQADADALGMTKFNTDGQAYANANGICTFYSAAQSGSFAKNNCAVGGAGSTVVYNQGAGVVSSNSSQAEADALGFNKFNIEGQANANTYGICTFYSVARSDYFTKNNCAAGGYGSAVLYSQGAGTSVSNTSQADADAQALAIFNANGQANANAYGSCTFYSVARSDYFTKNNCAPGGYGSAVLYNQGAGTAVSNASQADADAQALAIFNANGQANANAYGSCTFYSVARSDYFTKNNCPAGGAGSRVLYNQGAGTAVSNTSQADADAQALVLFNANGQANANTNGYCTFYSIALSSEITKNNCASGGVGSGVIYSQGAGIETSTVSQEDANSKGYVRWYTEGQAYINANGYCTFNSAALGGYFPKTNCGQGGESPSIYYGQAAGTITSRISQADADALAATKFYADGQANANASQGCIYKNTVQSRLFTRNNCAPGATPASVWYTVAAGVHTSYISQADANTYAQLQIDTYGQAYANSTASCVFYNKLINPVYYKTDCPAGTTNPYVYYSVEAGKYQSTISQADADNKALTEANTYGPAYANEVGRCLNPGEVEE